ncbi:MAG: ATP-binding protein [Verrucomicrobiales bacterium]
MGGCRRTRTGCPYFGKSAGQRSALQPGRRNHRIIVEEREDTVGLEVRDEGPGVPVDLRGKLFRPYAKSGSNGGQAGLGLYFCHLVITLWGGSIAYADRPGGGACFRISLPGTQPSAKEGRP